MSHMAKRCHILVILTLNHIMQVKHVRPNIIIKTKQKNYDRLLKYYKIYIEISSKTLKLLILEF